MERYILNNNIKTIIKRNNNTPRAAIVIFSKTNKDEQKAGFYYLITQLLYQGTKTKTAEEIATILDENAIDINIEKKADYIRFKIQCLNEDVEYALEIFKDIIENSTFESFEKEATKIIGEFNADLDSAKIQAQDNYYRTIFKNHNYGTGRKEIIEQIGSITKDDILKTWEEIKNHSQKNITVISDIETNKITKLLEKYLSCFNMTDMKYERKNIEEITENIISVVEKEDANQAQIFQGWQFPSIYSEDYASIILLNTILGSSGLSSRLFLELREKQGLAYTVRSVFEPYILCGNFFVYIATEPKNIKTSIAGFDKEIKKIMTEIVSETELEDAKNAAIGKRQFYQETNLLEASIKGYYEFLGLDYTFEEKLIENIKSVTKEKLIETAQKYFSKPNALCVLAPRKYLKEANLIC